MIVNEYIRRINYKGDLIPVFNVLKELQKSHLLAVPFENLDIHYDNHIELDIDSLYHKIVSRKRGGFCYELNGLFYVLLSAIGFDCSIISARVYNNEKDEFGQEFDHLAIIVKLDQSTYLTDVGFGEFAFHPLLLEMDFIQADPRGDFVIEEIEPGGFVVSKLTGDMKSPQYLFTMQKRALQQFTAMCKYQQTSPDSHFREKKLISRPTENGRITLSGNSLKITEDGEIKVEKEFTSDDFDKYLKEWFNIQESDINTGFRKNQ